MADDTLSPVGFERPIIKASVASEERYALACLMDHDQYATTTDFVRDIISDGLAQRGWDRAKRIEEYASYRLHCIRTGTTNVYGSE